jgi:serine/threonine-protein kinase
MGSPPALDAQPSLRTIASKHRDDELEERRRATVAVFKIGVVAWPAFIFADLVAARQHGGGHVAWMVGWRALGTFLAMVCLAYLERRPKAGARVLDAIDLLVFTLGGALIALIAVPFGGLATRSMQGVMLLAIVRATFVPSRWGRAVRFSFPPVLAFAATMGLAATWDADVRAQWSSEADVGVFLYDFLFVVAGTLLGTIASHLLYTARRQVWEARKLGAYRLKARIGSGSMGDVWLARHDPLDRPVALKVLHERAARDEGAVRRFVREARAASRLRHPNTIRVFDFGASDDGVWFMAMEHLEGVDLTTLVEEMGPLPAARAVRFTRQACAALTEAHDAGVVHRDVKPDNLFVCRMGDEPDFLKVLDFGIAKIEGAEEDATVTRAGWVHGTPAYMSPEVCNGDRADARSDVYSLGAVLYFLLTGTPPFTAVTAAAVMMAHVRDVPDAPGARHPVPADVERVVLRALEKDPDARYASARDLDAALAACKDAAGWTVAHATDFWTAFDQKPRSGVAPKPGSVAADDEADTIARPSVSRGMKAG